MNWHDNIKNDPYENDRDTPDGGGDLLMVAIVMLSIVIMMVFSSCKSVQPISISKDSVRVEMRHDSIYVFKHDSIFRDRWRSGDTIFVTTYKFKTLYKDKLVQVHDTIRMTENKEVPVKYVPSYYKNTSAGFWVLLVILLAVIGVKIYKLYIKIQTGGLLK